MEIRSSEENPDTLARKASLFSDHRVSVAFFSLCVCLAGCAAPGAPVARRPAAPKAITDLAVRQSGDAVVLEFTLPAETVQGNPLRKTPEIQVFRGFLPGGASSPSSENVFASSSLRPAVKIPPEMSAQYRAGNQFQFRDALAPADIAAHTGGNVFYMVRTRISGHASADSNVASVRIFPAPQPIQDLRAEVTRSAIKLSWTAVPIPSAGSLPAGSVLYRIFRSSNVANPPTNASPSSSNTQGIAASLPFGQIAETNSPFYNDTGFKFGETYAYYVVSVAKFEDMSVESEESATIEITPRDTFAPEVPNDLVAAVVSNAGTNALEVDLSWAISGESGIAGYNIYRSQTEAGAGTRLNSSLLLTPVFRDISALPEQQYFYQVTAVDSSGNESAPSAPVAVTIPVPNDKEE
ncbi:MAG TPA: hypothetical protein VGR81_09735 [Candidatus Acidoferrales bacterium]|nr:hypothetical protein [Candidatus Acidoferrales bacterium]